MPVRREQACIVFMNEGALREDFEEIWYVKVCYEKQFSISTAFSKVIEGGLKILA